MKNESGFVPVDRRVLIKPDPAQEKIGSIIVTDAHKDRAKYANTNGTMIAAGENAFLEWGKDALTPKPGDRVVFAQYAGSLHKSADGEEYNLCVADDLLAIIEVAS